MEVRRWRNGGEEGRRDGGKDGGKRGEGMEGRRDGGEGGDHEKRRGGSLHLTACVEGRADHKQEQA